MKFDIFFSPMLPCHHNNSFKIVAKQCEAWAVEHGQMAFLGTTTVGRLVPSTLFHLQAIHLLTLLRIWLDTLAIHVIL